MCYSTRFFADTESNRRLRGYNAIIVIFRVFLGWATASVNHLVDLGAWQSEFPDETVQLWWKSEKGERLKGRKAFDISGSS
jgi:hypothetical protein